MSINAEGQRRTGKCPTCLHTGVDCLCWMKAPIDPTRACDAIRQIYEALWIDNIDFGGNLHLYPSKEWGADTTEAISNIVKQVIPAPIDTAALPAMWQQTFRPMPGLDITTCRGSLKCPLCGQKAVEYREDISNTRVVQGVEGKRILVEGLYATENLDDGTNARWCCENGHDWPVTKTQDKKIDFI